MRRGRQSRTQYARTYLYIRTASHEREKTRLLLDRIVLRTVLRSDRRLIIAMSLLGIVADSAA